MKDMDEALAWLNWESPSKLSSNTRFWINRFSIPSLDSLEREEIVQSLERLVHSVLDPFEQAEVLTFCGVYYYFLAHFNEAETSLTNANKLYEYLDDLHRHAVTTWMLYLGQRAEGEYLKAFDNGRRARLHFMQKGVQYRQLGDTTAESWYQARVHDLTVYLIEAPEDMFEWIFEFQGSRLKATASQIRDHLQVQIENKEFEQVKDDMDALLEITRLSIDCEETAEALAYCGVAEWLMNRQMSSLYYFRSALAQYLPASHEYAILTWMLGLAESSILHMRAKAIVDLESAIEQFDRLRQQAINDNNIFKREFYTLHHVAMRRVLRTMMTV